MLLSVTTANQHASSATTMIGSTVPPIVPINEEPVSADSLNSKSEHCHAKHSSATVATVLPTITEERGESQRHMRSKSILGRIDRNAQAATKKPERASCRY